MAALACMGKKEGVESVTFCERERQTDRETCICYACIYVYISCVFFPSPVGIVLYIMLIKLVILTAIVVKGRLLSKVRNCLRTHSTHVLVN